MNKMLQCSFEYFIFHPSITLCFQSDTWPWDWISSRVHERFINPVCLLQVIKRLQSFSRMKSKKNRRSRRIRLFLKCPAAGSWSSTAPRPNSSARCPEKSKDRSRASSGPSQSCCSEWCNMIHILQADAIEHTYYRCFYPFALHLRHAY